MANTPFSNSMEPDNMPGADSATDERDARDGNGPERKVAKNSGADTPVAAGYPLPPDPHAPPGYPEPSSASAEVSDFGLNEKVEVAHSSSQLQYGLTK